MDDYHITSLDQLEHLRVEDLPFGPHPSMEGVHTQIIDELFKGKQCASFREFAEEFEKRNPDSICKLRAVVQIGDDKVSIIHAGGDNFQTSFLKSKNQAALDAALMQGPGVSGFGDGVMPDVLARDLRGDEVIPFLKQAALISLKGIGTQQGAGRLM